MRIGLHGTSSRSFSRRWMYDSKSLQMMLGQRRLIMRGLLEDLPDSDGIRLVFINVVRSEYGTCIHILLCAWTSIGMTLFADMSTLRVRLRRLHPNTLYLALSTFRHRDCHPFVPYRPSIATLLEFQHCRISFCLGEFKISPIYPRRLVTTLTGRHMPSFCSHRVLQEKLTLAFCSSRLYRTVLRIL